jgi:RNA polymerase sigma-70 factor (ECF subfamily)
MITSFPTTPGIEAPTQPGNAQAATQHAGWFEAMVRDYTGLAYSVAVRVVTDPAVAEDVVQESFLSVWRQAASYNQERGSVRTWLLTVVRNRAIDRLRAERSRPTSGATDVDTLLSLAGDQDVWADVSAALDRDTVQAALAALPLEQRRTIEMAYFDGLTHVEIAARMAVPLGTVKGRMRIGLQKLRSRFLDCRAA